MLSILTCKTEKIQEDNLKTFMFCRLMTAPLHDDTNNLFFNFFYLVFFLNFWCVLNFNTSFKNTNNHQNLQECIINVTQKKTNKTTVKLSIKLYMCTRFPKNTLSIYKNVLFIFSMFVKIILNVNCTTRELSYRHLALIN